MPMLPLPLPMLSLMSTPECTPSASPLLDAKTVKGRLFPVLKDPTSDTYLLLLLRLTPRPTHGYTIAVSMVDISAMVDTPTTDLRLTVMHLTHTLMCTIIMVLDTMVWDTTEERRGRLPPSQRPLPTLRLTHGCCMEDMDMDLDMVMVTRMPLTHTLTTTTL